MAYNLHFINKRKHAKVIQTNSSAQILPLSEEIEKVLTPSLEVIHAARRTGVLQLSGIGLKSVPTEVYAINLSGERGLTYNGFVDDDNNAWWKDVLLHHLNLSANKIVLLSEDIKNLSYLNYLDLSDNEITSLPNEIVNLTQLTYLNLSKNSFRVLPESLGALKQLQQLLVSHNLLSSLPEELYELKSLETLDIANNKFVNISERISELSHLKKLIIACNSIKELPETMVYLTEIATLDLSQNKLTKMINICNRKLKILKINLNLLLTFPILKHSPLLQELYISGNSISYFSELHISYMPNINILVMSKNMINCIPNEIGQLNYLSHLDVSFNSLNSLPYELGYIETLTTLNIEGNPLRSIKRTAWTSGTEYLKNFLRNRNKDEPTFYFISNNSSKQNKIHSPLAINLHELNLNKSLNLSNKELSCIPDECFEYLNNKLVKNIQFSNNKLTTFPAGTVMFGGSLTSLDISANWILELPDVFHNFKCIENLNISGNYLRYLPETFSNMADSLVSLNVAHNPLGTAIPSVIFKLISLEYLNVSDCLIMEINPKKFLQLEKLSNLDLSNNDIKDLPPHFGLCQQIKKLNVSGNRTNLSQEQVGSTEALLQHLRSLIKEFP